MADFKVKRCRPIVNELSVPGDKSISHRAVIIAALSNGPCVIDGFLPSEDCVATLDAIRALGVQVDVLGQTEGGAPKSIRIHGTRGVFREPEKDIDCGNSGTGMRLLAGILSAQPFSSRLTGDESLSGRPMNRIIAPLVEMGADIRAEGEEGRPPLAIRPSEDRKNIHYVMPMASAQVKSAILFAGLFADGKTTVTEPAPTRDHTEKMLEYFLVKTASEDGDISIWGRQVPESRDFTVPGDISSAAFWIAAAAAKPGSQLSIKNVGLNKSRTGVLRALVRMGAQISECIEEPVRGEPFGSVEVKGGELTGTTIGGDEIPNLIDELPVLAVAGALSRGTMIIRDAEELRVKETDRIATVAENLRLMGADVQEFPDGMEIHGGARLRGAKLFSHGDHRIAMAFAIAGLFADGETVIHDVDCVNTSYPGFRDQLKRIASGKGAPDSHTPVISSIAHSKMDVGRPRLRSEDSGDEEEMQ